MVIRVGSLVQVRGQRPTSRSQHAPEAALGGHYLVNISEPGTTADVYHWVSWSQLVDTTAVEAYAGLRRTPQGQWAVPDLTLQMTHPRWGLVLGDAALPLLHSFQGFNGAYAPLRGVAADVAPSPGTARIGVLAGAYRSPGCCEFFAPGTLVAGAGTFQWHTPSGTWLDALGGALHMGADGTTAPLVRVAGGHSRPTAQVDGELVQSGAGTGATVRARGLPTNALHLALDGGVMTPGFRRPLGPATEALQAAATANADLRAGDRVWLTGRLFGNHRGAEGLGVATSNLGGLVRARWMPVSRLRLSAGYQHLAMRREGEAFGGRGISLAASGAPTKQIQLGADLDWFLVAERAPETRVGASASYQAPGSPWYTSARYQAAWMAGSAVSKRHMGRMDWGYQTEVLAGGASVMLGHARMLEHSTTHATGNLYLTWSLRRALELSGSVFGTTFSPPQRPMWGLQATWTLRPTALPRAAGGLGFRGSLAGIVYLDENQNGVHDEGEPGLGGMSIDVDGSPTLVTDQDGRYAVAGLPAGAHSLRLDRGSYHALGPTARTVDVVPLRRRTVDFGLRWGARIQGLLYVDLDGSRGFDNGDHGVSADNVLLRDASGTVIAQTHVSRGRFQFTGLKGGSYTVLIDPLGLPVGYRPADSLEQTVYLTEGRPQALDIRLHATRALGGVVWEDADGNGRGGDRGDFGLGGIRVFLSNGLMTRTGPDGSYLFRDLPPGGYAVTTELTTGSRVALLPVEPREVLDLDFVRPRGVRLPDATAAALDGRGTSDVTALVVAGPIDVLPVGMGVQLTATARLSNGEGLGVTTHASWTSSDEEVLGVSPEGFAEGRTVGVAGATAEWRGVAADPLALEVVGGEPDQVVLSPVALRLRPGDTADLRVDIVDRAGRGGEVTPLAHWFVSDPEVVELDDRGQLRGLRDGDARVQARIGDAWSEPIEVQVTTARVTALAIEGAPARMPEGGSVQLHAIGFHTQLEVQDVTSEVTWTSSNPDVVRIDEEGRATALDRGTTRITASIGSLFTRTRTIAVTNQPPLSLEVLPPGMTLQMGDREAFRARARFEDGSSGPVTGVAEWTVDGAAATIAPDGTVTTLEPGEVTVRARYLGVESEPVTVTVLP
jgi:hypothetical protein